MDFDNEGDGKAQDEPVVDLISRDEFKHHSDASRYATTIPNRPKISDLTKLLTQVQAGKKIDSPTDATLLQLYGLERGYTVKGRVGQLFIRPENLKKIIERIFDAQVQRTYSDA